MPIHDWTRVPDGIFHDFHHAWIEEIKRYLNHGHLPEGYYALAEQFAGKLGPDVLTLHPTNGCKDGPNGITGGVRVAEVQPRVRYHVRTDAGTYAARAKAVVIRHASGHEIVAMIEIVSPGNKSSQRRFDSFIRKAEEVLAAEVNLLIVDLIPPTPRDPEGIHPAIWQDRGDEFTFDAQKPLTCVSYVSNTMPEAYVEPVGLGDALPEMPLFLTPEVYVPLPLEPIYQAAWNEVPTVWRDVLSRPA